MSIATQTGDDGTTGLMFNRRVPKTHPRVEAYGTIDELNAALGMARAFCEAPWIGAHLLGVQKDLVPLMGELAVHEEDLERYWKTGRSPWGPEGADALTALIVDLEKNHHIVYAGWATPGGTRGSACLDVARTVCRRAERAVVSLEEAGVPVNPEIVRYLNRLSDLCWLWARWIETHHGHAGDASADGGAV